MDSNNTFNVEKGRIGINDNTLHGKLITHMTKRREDEEGNVSSQELHFFYDSQSKPAFVEFEGERYRYIHSLQGDIIAIVDSAANTVVEYKYDAWGKPTAANSIENSIISDINPFRYRGYVFDDDINLYYLRSRYYHATLDRFINEDVYAGGQGRLLTHNMYAYCAGNPIMLQDPSGKKANYSLGDFFRTVGSMAKTFFNSLISTSKKAVNAFKNASSKYKKASGGRSLLLDIADQIPFDLNLKIDNFRITTKEVPNSIFYAALTTVSDYMGFPGVSSVVGDAVNSIPGVTGLGSAVDFSITWLSVRCGAWASAFEAGTHIQYGIEMDVVYPDASKIYLSFRFEEDDYFSGLNMTAACGNNMGIISVQNKTI